MVIPSNFCLLDNPKECSSFFRALLRKENAYMIAGNMLQVDLQMRNITEIDFASVIMLEAICEELSHEGCNVHGNSPQDKDVATFLRQAGFYNKKFDTQGKRIVAPGNSQIIEIQMGEKKIQIKDLMAFDNLMNKASLHLNAGNTVSMDNYVAILKEICGNSTEWGNNIRKNWTIAAKYEDDEVQFVALDLGQGIIKSLRKRLKERMRDYFNNKSNDEVLKDVFKRYYGSKSRDPNRNQGLPFIRKCFDDKIIKKLSVVTNNVIIDFRDNQRNSTFDKDNKVFPGTLYSWSVDFDCLNNKLK